MKVNRRKGLLAGFAAVAAVALSVAGFSSSVTAGDEAKAKVGAAAPDFKLVDTNGKEHSLASYTAQGKIVVLEWFNSGCPFVVRHHEKYTTMRDLAAKFGDKVQWIAINSGAPGKEGHGLDKDAVAKWKIAYPVLNDETGKVGKMYGAKTTPHMFIVDAKGVLRYAGAIDNDRADKMSADQKINYVDRALSELTSGKEVTTAETLSYGCGVKYGN
ncbi:MAG TPA: thioredoxin family protein [Phycisphaerales bacterium]|nr:thioredoxin family protein [Phycisphaerales bacterium]